MLIATPSRNALGEGPTPTATPTTGDNKEKEAQTDDHPQDDVTMGTTGKGEDLGGEDATPTLPLSPRSQRGDNLEPPQGTSQHDFQNMEQNVFAQ